LPHPMQWAARTAAGTHGTRPALGCRPLPHCPPPAAARPRESPAPAPRSVRVGRASEGRSRPVVRPAQTRAAFVPATAPAAATARALLAAARCRGVALLCEESVAPAGRRSSSRRSLSQDEGLPPGYISEIQAGKECGSGPPHKPAGAPTPQLTRPEAPS
jgi:hypothetical protein